jgi:hypothetical protein
MKIYWFYSDLIKVMMDLVLYAFILITMGSSLIYYMRNFLLQCSKNFGMQTFECATNALVSL